MYTITRTIVLSYVSCLNKELIEEILQMYLHARKIRDMFKGGGSNKLYPAHNLGSLDDYKSSQLNIFRFILATKYVWEGMGF